MPTRRSCALISLLIVLVFGAPASAQVRVDGATEVRSLQFSGVKALNEHRLEKVLQTRARGPAYGLRKALGKLPLVPDPAPHPFSPLTLQEDVVRLRGAYAASGFFRTGVRYDVRRDDAKNLLDITFLIDEGPPTLVTDVVVKARDSLATLPVPEGEQSSWDGAQRAVVKQRGRRLVVDDARKGRDKLEKWWRNRGFPRAEVVTALGVDSTGSQAWLTYRVAPGSFARFGDLQVEGGETISDVTVGKMVPIHRGDPYSESALEQAALDLQKLDIVRVAKVDVPALGPADSTFESATPASAPAAEPVDPVLPPRVRITEGDRRLIGGDVGYVTDAGFTTEARWSHRNFWGGGRSLTLTGIAQTGWLALVDDPDIRYRLSLSLKQPAFGHRHLSGVISPFVEHRDDSQDLSTQIGLNTTLIYQRRTLNSMSLDYQVARREVKQYRFGDLASGDIDLFTFLVHVAQGLVDSLGSHVNSSTVTLSGTYGMLDDPANPRQGAIARPAVQVTAPTSISSTAYWRIDASANGFVPLGRSIVIATRARFGQLFPFGKSVPGPGEDPRAKFLQLHDAAFTAGGTGDVRGWENRLLGPKVPDVRFNTAGDSSLVPFTEGYDPYGGLARATFSIEARMPVPRLGPSFGSVIFLDGGRVWTSDERFGLRDDPNGQDELFFAAGGGFTLRTPVGPIEVSAGYKLNPSVTDLVDAQDALAGAQAGIPLESLPRHSNRRWQFHLAIGTSY